MPACVDVGNRGIGKMLVLGQREGLVGIHHVDEVMRHAALLVCGRFRRADVHPAIDLPRIRGDDFAVKLLRKFYR